MHVIPVATAKEIGWEQDDGVTKDNGAEINCASVAIGTCRHCVLIIIHRENTVETQLHSYGCTAIAEYW